MKRHDACEEREEHGSVGTEGDGYPYSRPLARDARAEKTPSVPYLRKLARLEVQRVNVLQSQPGMDIYMLQSWKAEMKLCE
jgi:hypothetical protein